MAGAAWLTDAGAAFAQARAEGRPLFLYWGAVWCPPCNRIKAAVFQHPRFADLAARAVLLHLDGDAPGAQLWATSTACAAIRRWSCTARTAPK